MATCKLFLGLLLLASCSAPREVYHFSSGPAYHAAPITHRPRQPVLDSLARASMRAKAHKI